MREDLDDDSEVDELSPEEVLAELQDAAPEYAEVWRMQISTMEKEMSELRHQVKVLDARSKEAQRALTSHRTAAQLNEQQVAMKHQEQSARQLSLQKEEMESRVREEVERMLAETSEVHRATQAELHAAQSRAVALDIKLKDRAGEAADLATKLGVLRETAESAKLRVVQLSMEVAEARKDCARLETELSSSQQAEFDSAKAAKAASAQAEGAQQAAKEASARMAVAIEKAERVSSELASTQERLEEARMEEKQARMDAIASESRACKSDGLRQAMETAIKTAKDESVVAAREAQAAQRRVEAAETLANERETILATERAAHAQAVQGVFEQLKAVEQVLSRVEAEKERALGEAGDEKVRLTRRLEGAESAMRQAQSTVLALLGDVEAIKGKADAIGADAAQATEDPKTRAHTGREHRSRRGLTRELRRAEDGEGADAAARQRIRETLAQRVRERLLLDEIMRDEWTLAEAAAAARSGERFSNAALRLLGGEMAAIEHRSSVHAASLQDELVEDDRRMDAMSHELRAVECRVGELEAALCDARVEASSRVDARAVRTSLALICKDLAELEASDASLRVELLAVTNRSLKDEIEIAAAWAQNASLRVQMSSIRDEVRNLESHMEAQAHELQTVRQKLQQAMRPRTPPPPAPPPPPPVVEPVPAPVPAPAPEPEPEPEAEPEPEPEPQQELPPAPPEQPHPDEQLKLQLRRMGARAQALDGKVKMLTGMLNAAQEQQVAMSVAAFTLYSEMRLIDSAPPPTTVYVGYEPPGSAPKAPAARSTPSPAPSPPAPPRPRPPPTGMLMPYGTADLVPPCAGLPFPALKSAYAVTEATQPSEQVTASLQSAGLVSPSRARRQLRDAHAAATACAESVEALASAAVGAYQLPDISKRDATGGIRSFSTPNLHDMGIKARRGKGDPSTPNVQVEEIETRAQKGARRAVLAPQQRTTIGQAFAESLPVKPLPYSSPLPHHLRVEGREPYVDHVAGSPLKQTILLKPTVTMPASRFGEPDPFKASRRSSAAVPAGSPARVALPSIVHDASATKYSSDQAARICVRDEETQFSPMERLAMHLQNELMWNIDHIK